MLNENPNYDCIVHTHNPLTGGSDIPVATQKPFQCGSLECGMNTASNLKGYGDIKAVYLDKHGANILFKSSTRSIEVIDFLSKHLQLGTKVGL
jgi:hypothetical protein